MKKYYYIVRQSDDLICILDNDHIMWSDSSDIVRLMPYTKRPATEEIKREDMVRFIIHHPSKIRTWDAKWAEITGKLTATEYTDEGRGQTIRLEDTI